MYCLTCISFTNICIFLGAPVLLVLVTQLSIVLLYTNIHAYMFHKKNLFVPLAEGFEGLNL